MDNLTPEEQQILKQAEEIHARLLELQKQKEVEDKKKNIANDYNEYREKMQKRADQELSTLDEQVLKYRESLENSINNIHAKIKESRASELSGICPCHYTKKYTVKYDPDDHLCEYCGKFGFSR